MTVRTQTTTGRISRLRKLSVAGIATAGAAAAALTLAPSPAHAVEQAPAGVAAGKAVAAEASAKKAKKEKKQYKDNLDGWIREALDIMKSEDIPGSYEGLHRNIMRESGGNPNAQNNWDVNAQNGTPSKGLLQVIQPTFDAYHVKGTKRDVTDPVANLTAAANYAADRYGSIDNVDSAY
ncbi:transglycosylase SLT domain-containing protein [Streptomyces sp. NPDC007883]|uniref:transglycosylase SLT domain-containing protein n=1 Tax=Streptomyces sp. NPDC007883 TaxID=3155116 RepID=UPI0033D83EF0